MLADEARAPAACELHPSGVTGRSKDTGRGSPLLQMRTVSKSFGTTRAVRNVSLEFGRAEVVGLMRGNGAGKSTLMKIVGGLIEARRRGNRAFWARPSA